MVASDNEFVEPEPRPERASAVASTSRLDGASASPLEPSVQLAHDDNGDAGSAIPDQANDQVGNGEAITNGEHQFRTNTPPTASASSRPKLFLKSTSPDLPLRVHLQPELDHIDTKRLTIYVKAHGGQIDSRIGHAHLVVVDPKLFGPSKRLLRSANALGQPIPVVTTDYIYDCVAQGQKLDLEDPKYKFDGTQKPATATTITNGTSTARSLNGRNPFTESDRQAIISYFIDKPEASWSLNACAKELAERITTHSHTSFQSYLQANFEKNWNLKEKVLLARRAVLEGDPSELQARVLRSQYSASPALAEQTAPSDGWPRVSPALSSHESRPAPPDQALGDDAAPSQGDPDDEELEVRQPNPGLGLEAVEKSPTKVHLPVIYASSEPSEAPSSSDSSLLRQTTTLAASGLRPNPAASPSVDEESDPEEYSAKILEQINKASSGTKPSGKSQRTQTQDQSRSSDSEGDSESGDDETDELESSSEVPLADEIAESRRQMEVEAEESEWEGTRLANRKLRERDAAQMKETRVKFVDEEKKELVKQLANYVIEHGRAPDGLTQDVVLAKPADDFWERFAAANPSHSTISWKSHYLKNRVNYRQLIEIEIEERNSDVEELDQVNGEDPAELDLHTDREANHDGEASSRRGFSISNILGRLVPSFQSSPKANQRVQEPPSESSRSQYSEDTSMPSDGIIVMLPALTDEDPIQSKQRKRRNQPKDKDSSKKPSESLAAPEEQGQWPEASSPPLMDDEDQNLMQIETQVDAAMGAPREEPLRVDQNSSHFAEDVDPEMERESEVDEAEEDAGDEAGMSAAESIYVEETAARVASNAAPASRMAQQREHQRVDAGTPVLARHRSALFYDFSMDSDEEQRILRVRSRPSLPNLESRQWDMASRTAVASDRVASHIATPACNPKKQVERQTRPSRSPLQEERAKRTREWARSVSATPSSTSSDLPLDFPPTVARQPSRPRAQRIDRTPRIGSGSVPDLSPRLQQQPSRQASGGRISIGLPAISPTLAKVSRRETRSSNPHTSSRTGKEAAVAEYREAVKRFRSDYGLEMQEARSLLMHFDANVKKARNFIDSWLRDMEMTYGVEADVALEYVKTAQGDFEQAETFLRLATVTRSNSTSDLLGKRSSRSASHSASPAKRRQLAEDSSFARQGSSRRESAKKHRR